MAMSTIRLVLGVMSAPGLHIESARGGGWTPIAEQDPNVRIPL